MLIDAPARESRADIRRRQILEAAEACFCARGFNAATMAEIAAAAGLSVGQIYRFFESKEAVVEAITDQQMEELLDTVAEVETRDGAADAIRLLVAKGNEKLSRPGMAALLLEITAEASRNPRVAAVVRAQDLRIREALARLIVSAQGSNDPDEIQRRAELVCLVFEGAAARLIRNPEFAVTGLHELVAGVLEKLLSSAEATGCA